MYLVVDIGTSSMKAGVIDEGGNLLDYGRLFFSFSEAENFDARQWEGHFVALLRKFDLSVVEAVSISSNGPTLVGVDSEGHVLTPVLHWQDGRHVPVWGSSYYLPKVAWLRKEYPQIYSRVSVFLSPSEFLLYRLTGVASMASSDEEFSSYIWTDEQLARNAMDSGKFPSILPVGACVGEVGVSGAALSGLTQGISCYAMGSDFQASLLGAGAVEPGVLCDRAGTSEGLNLCCVRDSGKEELRDLPHVIKPLRNSSAILSSTGSLFEWYRRLTGQEGLGYDDMLGFISQERSGHPYFFPTLKHGGLWEFAGGMLMGLDPHHSRYSLGRAMLDSIGFSLRHGLELLEESHGPIKSIVLCGGQAKSHVWNQMKADLLGRKLQLPRVVDAELVGCACAAAYGSGRYSSLRDAAKGMVSIEKVYVPQPEGQGEIGRAYELYRRISPKVKSFYRKKLRIELDKK